MFVVNIGNFQNAWEKLLSSESGILFMCKNDFVQTCSKRDVQLRINNQQDATL
jgi:hypothetical protein